MYEKPLELKKKIGALLLWFKTRFKRTFSPPSLLLMDPRNPGFGFLEVSWRNGFKACWTRLFFVFCIFDAFFKVERAKPCSNWTWCLKPHFSADSGYIRSVTSLFFTHRMKLKLQEFWNLALAYFKWVGIFQTKFSWRLHKLCLCYATR